MAPTGLILCALAYLGILDIILALQALLVVHSVRPALFLLVDQIHFRQSSYFHFSV